MQLQTATGTTTATCTCPALTSTPSLCNACSSTLQASKLDYVVEPRQDERVSMMQSAAAAAHVPSNSTRFAKKMREVQRKQKSTTARAAKPSVEGRTITLMNT